MALPKLNTPQYTKTLPLSKVTITYRPYTVGDEKLLLAAAAARESDPTFYVKNTMNVIRNCLNDRDGIVDRLPAVEVEYILMQIRAKSVGEQIEIRYKEPETGKEMDLTLDLEAFQIVVPEDHKYRIELTEEVGLMMRDLTFADKMAYGVKFNDSNKTDVIFETIIDSIQAIYDADTVYTVGENTTREEVKQFVESLAGASSKLYQFIATMPQLEVKVNLPSGEQKVFNGKEIDFLALSPAT